MSNITRRSVKSLLTLLIAALATFGFVGVGTAAPVAPEAASAAITQAECGDTSGFDQVALSSLPPEASDTVDLIKAGGPYPYPQDGTVFENREGLLPDCEEGYYHEYTVETPGSPDRGARRIVTGSDGEYFYTEDHYESFVLVDINA
ncbi:MAG: ribonuclease [Pseudonocardiaceae bacterium]|nr:ribonuclease [Pseudonocardiaceae bacterium]